MIDSKLIDINMCFVEQQYIEIKVEIYFCSPFDNQALYYCKLQTI
jgi:hypothetical protein